MTNGGAARAAPFSVSEDGMRDDGRVPDFALFFGGAYDAVTSLGVYDVTATGEIVDDVEVNHTLGFFVVPDGNDFVSSLSPSAARRGRTPHPQGKARHLRRAVCRIVGL